MSPRVLTALGQEFLEEIPHQFRRDPDIRAVIDVKSREVQRLRDRLEALSAGVFPQLDSAGAYTAIWEFTLGLSVNPDGYTLADRRSRVLAFLQKLHRTGSGLDFEQTASQLMGITWTYQEHIPGDALSPPENTIRVKIAYASSSLKAADIRALLRAIIPAHLEIQVQYDEGFIIGDSLIGIDPL